MSDGVAVPPASGPAGTGIRRGGYLASVVGALGGALLGAAGARVIGPAGFGLAARHVHPRPTDGGLAGAFEGVGDAIGTVVVATAFAALLAVFAVWLGAVLGCGVALRARRHHNATVTALGFGAAAPVSFVVLAVLFGRFGGIGHDAAYVFHPLWIGLAACLARRLTAGGT